MDGTYDILIIGGGPAGLSAAVAARGRGRSCLVISNPREDNPLSKAPLVDNYLGLPGLTGAEMMETFHSHARQMGAHFRSGRVLSAMDMGTSFFLTIGEEVAEGRRLCWDGVSVTAPAVTGCSTGRRRSSWWEEPRTRPTRPIFSTGSAAR